MSKIYLLQSNLTISLNTGIALANVDEALIKYIKPDGTEGQWTATVVDSKIEYNIAAGNIDQIGEWTVWVNITFTNTKVSVGEPAKLIVYKEGE